MERFLYRLSCSEHAEKFILKGALMLRVWHAATSRPTMDIDVLGMAQNDTEIVVVQIREILGVEIDPDGIVFDGASVRAERITEDANYPGIRIRFLGRLDSAKINMQIDIGFGDIVYPASEFCALPSLLDFPAPNLLGYSRESVVAEKFEAMVKLSALNSRMKDFYDIWLLSQNLEFSGHGLAEALKLTLERRGTELPDDIVAFSTDYATNKQVQWNAFYKRLGDERVLLEFAEVTFTISQFLAPIVDALLHEAPAPRRWSAPGPWA